jgi:hypothetical protein
MQNQDTQTYICQACGHVFDAQPQVIARQPTCPACKTYGRLSAAPPKAAQAQGPQPRAPQPRGPQPRGPRRPMPQRSDDVVEVRADAHYGTRRNSKAVLNTVIILGLAVGMIVTLYLIITRLDSGRAEHQRQMMEEVLDVDDFEAAIDRAVDEVRTTLNRVPEARVSESSDVTGAMQAIAAAGHTNPVVTMPLRPGSPLRVHTFSVTAPHERTNTPVSGYVVLLYYRTSEEARSAGDTVSRELDGLTSYTFRIDENLWYVGYMGVSHGGALLDALRASLGRGRPATAKQVRERTGILE